MKYRFIIATTLFLLSSCAIRFNELPANTSQQSINASNSSQRLAQAETQTFQGIAIQVAYRNPKNGELILPLTVASAGDDSIWSPGESTLKLGEELVLASELIEIEAIPSTDGGVTGIAHRLELRFDLSNLNSDISMGLLEIPYVFSRNAENGGEVTKIVGPWVFEIPLTPK